MVSSGFSRFSCVLSLIGIYCLSQEKSNIRITRGSRQSKAVSQVGCSKKVRPVRQTGVEQSWHVLTAAHLSPSIDIALSWAVITFYRSVDGLSVAVITHCFSLIAAGWNCINVCFLFSGHYGHRLQWASVLRNLVICFPW